MTKLDLYRNQRNEIITKAGNAQCALDELRDFLTGVNEGHKWEETDSVSMLHKEVLDFARRIIKNIEAEIGSLFCDETKKV